MPFTEYTHRMAENDQVEQWRSKFLPGVSKQVVFSSSTNPSAILKLLSLHHFAVQNVLA